MLESSEATKDEPNPIELYAENMIIEKLQKRCQGQLSWLEKDHPEVFSEQLHTIRDTQERVYWHYGYAIALRDALNLMGAGVDTHKY